MYRMDAERIDTLASGEVDYEHLRVRLAANAARPAIININVGTTVKVGGLCNYGCRGVVRWTTGTCARGWPPMPCPWPSLKIQCGHDCEGAPTMHHSMPRLRCTC